jgi:hypothetical protein
MFFFRHELCNMLNRTNSCLSATEFNTHMGRYGYVDVNAEGAVGGSTDFVGPNFLMTLR